MSDELWKRVDEYILDALHAPDPTLDAALKKNAEAGLPHIDVSAAQGKFLHLLARIGNAKRILEIGTLGGYSTIWLARALPRDGRLITLELDPKHAEVARTNIDRAGLAWQVEIRIGPALRSLEQLEREKHEPFDFIFIDADKDTYPEYVEHAIALSRPGTTIVCDNVVRKGAVVDGERDDERVRGVRRMFDQLRQERRLDATAIQTVGSKGYDGFVIAVVAGRS